MNTDAAYPSARPFSLGLSWAATEGNHAFRKNHHGHALSVRCHDLHGRTGQSSGGAEALAGSVRRGGAGTPTCPCALAKLRWDEAKQNRLQRLNRQTDVEAGFALGQAVGATVESSWQEGVDLLADFREADAIRGIAAEQDGASSYRGF